MIHVYTIHGLLAIGCLQYFLKQHMVTLHYSKEHGRGVGLKFCNLACMS